MYLKKGPIQPCLRRELLENPWHPSNPQYQFPATFRHRKNGKSEKIGINEQYFKTHNWLAYSHAKQGLLCKFCVVFSSHEGGRGNQLLGRLVTEPLTKFDKLTGKDGYLPSHETTDYHKNAVIRGLHFLRTTEKQNESVIDQLRRGDEELVKKNRQILRSLLRAVIICGRSGNGLRGHRDSGNPLKGHSSNDGLFREILRSYVDLGDATLTNHFNDGAKNAQYTSPEMQNEMISVCGENIKKMLAARINSAKFITVIADETTDNGKLEQLSICVRYVDSNDTIREDFLKFAITSDLTGAGIAEKIVSELLKENIDLTGLVGIALDGAAAMSGHTNGAQAHIRLRYPTAVYVHCASHSLNLVISDSSKCQSIRNCWGAIQAITSFFTFGKRLRCLEENILSKDPTSKRIRLPTFTDTRWIDRHDGVLLFKEFLPAIKDSLEQISTWPGKGDSLANMYLKSLDSEFIVSITVLEAVLSRTRPVAKMLQQPSIDLKEAMELVSNLQELLQSWRQSADEKFHEFFQDSEGKPVQSYLL